jgi:hypothetical protein
MPSQRSEIEKPIEIEPQLPALTDEQRNLLDAYRLGQLDEERFQECLAADPTLSDYVRKVCRPPTHRFKDTEY